MVWSHSLLTSKKKSVCRDGSVSAGWLITDTG